MKYCILWQALVFSVKVELQKNLDMEKVSPSILMNNRILTLLSWTISFPLSPFCAIDVCSSHSAGQAVSGGAVCARPSRPAAASRLTAGLLVRAQL